MANNTYSTARLQRISSLALDTSRKIIKSPEKWREFLACASKFYKAYGFDDQLLIYAQRPDAEACASMEIWNTKMQRWVNAGAKSIALIDKDNGNLNLKYVFDISDTHAVIGGQKPYLWKMQDEYQVVVSARMGELYGLDDSENFAERLMNYTSSAVKENYTDYLHDLTYDLGGSFLEDLEELNLNVIFRDTLTASVQCAVLNRCGLESSRYLADDDLRGITNFNTLETLAHLGNAYSRISGDILRQIEKVVREQEKLRKTLAKSPDIHYTDNRNNFSDLKRERSGSNGRYNIHEERGLSDSGINDGRNDRGISGVGEIWNAQANLFAGTSERSIHINAADRPADEPSAGDRPDSAKARGFHAEGVNEPAWSERSIKSQQSNGMGTTGQQPESNGRGTDFSGTHLQLNHDKTAAGITPAVFLSNGQESAQMSLFPTVEEQIENIAQAKQDKPTSAVPAAPVGQDIIDRILTSGGNESGSVERIIACFQKDKTGSAHTSFLINEYGTGGKGFRINGQEYALWFDKDGFRIASGHTVNIPECTTLPWVQVSIRIYKLLVKGQYAVQEKIDAARDYEFQELSEKLWNLSHDLSDEAKPQEYLPSILTPCNNFPEQTQKIAGLLKDTDTRAAIISELSSFVESYRGNPDLLRFPRLYQPEKLLQRVIDMGQSPKSFHADPAFQPVRPSFITQDEIDHNESIPFVRSHVVEQSEKISLHDTAPEKSAEHQNYRIVDNNLGVGGPKAKYSYNIAAIRLLKQLEQEKRMASPEEQGILARYVGWGGISQAFDGRNQKWKKEYSELKELLTEQEYDSARSSVLNSHYTSPEVINAIYKAAERMKIPAGNILEPAMGIGNFLGLLPESMGKSKLYGVELDSITGRLAKMLYPKADITVNGFENTSFSDDFFDFAVGNVPFGEYKVSDKRYDKDNLLIHDYFFAKTLDKIRPGGILAFITSKGTLDKQNPAVRQLIARKADLLGAIRLPNNAFKSNAGTEVTADIIFLQKRGSTPEKEPDWIHTGENADGIPVNRYFLKNPSMILGTMTYDDRMYGSGKDTTCAPLEGAVLSYQLEEAIKNIALPNQELLQTKLSTNKNQPDKKSIPADPAVRNFSYTLVDGELYFRENSRMKPVQMGVLPAARVYGMLEIRDCVRTLIDLQLNNAQDNKITAEQNRLNTLFDTFTKKFGLINSLANKQAFESDSAYPLLCSLEVLDEDGKLERKADMFSKRTIQCPRTISSVDTASEALAVSIGEKACVDLGYMAQLMGGSDKIDGIVSALKGVIFKDPATGAFDYDGKWYAGWQTADEYLSGNVREKLTVAREAAKKDPFFTINAESLEKVQPKDLTAAEIDVRIGATWIKPEYYRQFLFELFQTSKQLQKSKIDVLHSSVTGEWNVKGKNADNPGNARAYATFGTKRRNGYFLFEDCLNLRDTRIYDIKTDADGKEQRVINGKETTLAQQKQDAIGDAFRQWIFKDPDRRADICKTYNTAFNAIRPREYDGNHIVFHGMNPEISLRPHQKNAVAHILYGDNTLLAHCVGAGKTFEMAAAAMESKQLGLIRKSLFVVPNHLTDQWGGDFLRLYPGANILVATKKDFEPNNRKKFCARIATGDFDAVVIGHTQFEKIPLSPERQEAFVRNQISEITDALRETKEADGEQYTIKQMEKTKKNLQARLSSLHDDTRKDNVVNFEELGIDRLFVDEAHGYKNLFLHTKMRNVAGISQTEAKKSSDMFAKCRYMDELTGRRGIIFATGTPVSNSMTELYTMMRYLQYDSLKEHGLEHFDSWASTFGEKVTAIELAPEGTGFRSKTRFAKFFNLPELMSFWKEAADIQTADMLCLPVPDTKYINVVTKPSGYQKELVQSFSERADAVRKGIVQPYEDNMLKITSDGRKLALDQRLQNPLLPDEPDSKVNTCVRNIYQIWDDTTDIKGTQLVFCDLSTPGKSKPIEMQEVDGVYEMIPDQFNNVYDDMRRKLTAKGIPEEEIAFIHEAATDTQKAQLFSKVRKGQVRILFGSTAKMGAGTNVQTRLAALHHLDCPWRPSDIEQREGRILRQGNENKFVRILKYVTEGTFDAYNWSLIETKQKFIGQIMTSKLPARSCEDVDATALSYAEVKALATGDPRIKEKMDLDIQVSKLKLLKANHDGQQYEMQDRIIHFFPAQIKLTQEKISGLNEDKKTLLSHPVSGNDFSMEILGTNYTERKDAGNVLIEIAQRKNIPEGKLNCILGSYRGFSLSLTFQNGMFYIAMKGKLSYTAELGTDAVGNIARMNHVLECIPNQLESAVENLSTLNTQLENTKTESELTFPQGQELAEKSARLNQLNLELNEDNKSGEQKENSNKERTQLHGTPVNSSRKLKR